jgi:hypothetical protein
MAISASGITWQPLKQRMYRVQPSLVCTKLSFDWLLTGMFGFVRNNVTGNWRRQLNEGMNNNSHQWA